MTFWYDSFMDLPFLGQIATQGILGLLLALSLFANWYFIKSIQTLNDKRVDDAKQLTTKILDPLEIVKNNSDLLIKLFQNFLNNLPNGTNKQ